MGTMVFPDILGLRLVIAIIIYLIGIRPLGFALPFVILVFVSRDLVLLCSLVLALLSFIILWFRGGSKSFRG